MTVKNANEYTKLLNGPNKYNVIEVPKLIENIAYGKSVSFTEHELYELNYPNYPKNDILIEHVNIDIDAYNPETQAHAITASGRCKDFKEVLKNGGSFPDLVWEHVSVSLIATIVTQLGRACHNVCVTETNGVALRNFDMKYRRPATMHDVSFTYTAKGYERKGQGWAESNFKFINQGKTFATVDTVSMGVFRDYSAVESSMQRHTQSKSSSSDYQPIGERLIMENLLTSWQRDRLLQHQEELKKTGQDIQFGTLAVKSGFCAQGDIERCAAANG